MTLLMVLFLLIAFHAICDFALQSETMAINKNLMAHTELQLKVPWYYWLSAHALTHGAAVAIITQSVWLGIIEVIAHFCIDCLKCCNQISMKFDQFLHIMLKLLYVLVLFVSSLY